MVPLSAGISVPIGRKDTWPVTGLIPTRWPPFRRCVDAWALRTTW